MTHHQPIAAAAISAVAAANPAAAAHRETGRNETGNRIIVFVDKLYAGKTRWKWRQATEQSW